MSRRGSRPVYSTDRGRQCPKCGWPADDCRCSSSLEEPVPARITARLAIERSGRKGKTVSVIYGLPRNDAFLQELARDLKKACGAGGSHRDDRVEIQGDHLDAIRALLRQRGWVVKG